jgi:hypothetical protein
VRDLYRDCEIVRSVGRVIYFARCFEMEKRARLAAEKTVLEK